jgi:hypothetical protein
VGNQGILDEMMKPAVYISSVGNLNKAIGKTSEVDLSPILDEVLKSGTRKSIKDVGKEEKSRKSLDERIESANKFFSRGVSLLAPEDILPKSELEDRVSSRVSSRGDEKLDLGDGIMLSLPMVDENDFNQENHPDLPQAYVNMMNEIRRNSPYVSMRNFFLMILVTIEAI